MTTETEAIEGIKLWVSAHVPPPLGALLKPELEVTATIRLAGAGPGDTKRFLTTGTRTEQLAAATAWLAAQIQEAWGETEGVDQE